MNGQLFLQTIVAIIWDFDKTLIPGYMQDPIFHHFEIDGAQFWREVNQLPNEYRRRGAEIVSPDTLYLNHMLSYVRAGKMKSLSNAKLREMGGELAFYAGLPEFFKIVKDEIGSDDRYQKHGISVEHYIVSTGLRQMILGSKVAEHVDGVWACEFVEGAPGPGYLDQKQNAPISEGREISDIAYSIGNTTKTRAVFEINKGTNCHPEVDVNASVAHTDRRIPFQNMIYVADGPSDVPVFSIVNQYGGKCFAVYKARAEKEFAQVNELQSQKRIQSFGEANYEEGSQSYMWIRHAVRQIADRIARDRERLFGDKTGSPPGHILDEEMQHSPVDGS